MIMGKRINIGYLKNGYEQSLFTPYEVCEEIVKRSEEYKDMNIWIQPPDMKKIKPYINKIEQADRKNYPLWGIPFAIKDNIDLENTLTTAACKEYEYLPNKSAFVVDKLIKAGAIPVGKTNLDQFATGLVGTRSPYGEVHNSLKPELISGGSSSGSAVAVGLGLAAFSLGTDTAGSGRVPAALNCLVGYKPPLGAWSTGGVVPACASLDCVTVFANNIEDAELVNECARGFDENCCWSKEFTKIEKKLPKKIVLAKNCVEFYGQFAEIYKTKWESAVERLKGTGIDVEYIDYTMFKEAASILYDGPWVAERWKDIGPFIEKNPNAAFPVTEAILKSGNKEENTATKLFESMHKLQEYKMKARAILKDSVLIMPTAGGTFTRDEVRENPITTNSQMGLYTNHCNLLDLCAAAVPENSKDMDMPFGITIFALSNNEGVMLGMAEEFLNNESIELAVCGQHMRELKLEYQLMELGAKFKRSAFTAPEYRLYKLNTEPIKPALIKDIEKGGKIEVEIYDILINNLGKFMMNINSPLAIGNISLDDGSNAKGFIGESYVKNEAEDITEIGSFRKSL